LSIQAGGLSQKLCEGCGARRGLEADGEGGGGETVAVTTAQSKNKLSD